MIDFYLRVFLAAAKNNSFTKAAEFLNISQPAVTHQIKHLEEMFKTSLFVRQGNKVCLTKAGEILYKYSDEIGRLYRQALKEMTELSSRVSGDLYFGVTSLLGIYLLPLIINGFKKRYADVKLCMQIGNSKEIIRCLRDGIVELAIVSEPVPMDPSFVIIPFYEDTLVLIAPPDHPWCREGSIDPERIFEEDFILREPGSGTRDFYIKALQNLFQKKYAQSAMVLGSTEAIKRGVRGKLGVSIVSRLACQLELEQGMLREIELNGLKMKRSFYIVYRSEENLTMQAIKWKEYLLDQRNRNFVI